MLIKSASYLHKKKVNWALNMVFFNAFVLIKQTKFVPLETFERAVPEQKISIMMT